MATKGGKRREQDKEKATRLSHSSGDESGESEGGENEDRPLSFVLPGDDTGNGIDYNILDDESWETLQGYCKKWGIKQAHLESIYSRFARTIIRTEHLDFTYKPHFQVSLDFLADEFLATSGEFAAQIFIQTWFLRPKRGLPSPHDRRCVDFTRLVIMCCDLARLGDYELLVNFWACVLHRFGRLFPSGSVDLDTHLNTELVQEVVSIIHTNVDKKTRFLLAMLLAEARDHPGQEGTSAGGDDREEGEGGEEGERGPRRRYLSLRVILRFCLQHPALLYPVVQFQRVLRSKIIGSRYWLRRRKPASERGVDLRSLLGLPDAYDDVFDRIASRRDVWVVALGHLLLRALETDTASGGGRGRGSGEGEAAGGDGGGRGVQDERYERLLKNCLRTVWHEEHKMPLSSARSPTGACSDVIPDLTAKMNQLATAAKSATALGPWIGNKKRGERMDAEGQTPPRDICESRVPKRAASPARGGRTGGPTTSEEAPGRPCTVCLTQLSTVAMCQNCGRRAAKALKDAHGSRLGRVFLVPYGDAFGIGEADALECEGNAVHRWVRLHDDEAGADFFYNVHYDSSVWAGEINLPKAEVDAKPSRRRKRGGVTVGGVVTVNAATTPPGNEPPPRLDPAARSSGEGARSTSTAAGASRHRMKSSAMAADRATPPTATGSGGGRSDRPTTKISHPERPAAAPRVVFPSKGGEVDGPVPGVVVDAHRRMHPPFRLVPREDGDAVAAGGLGGVLPAGAVARPSSRQVTTAGGTVRPRS